jgi:hemolysin III
MIFLVTGRPRLWPRVFSYHEAFHVLVVAAAAVHFTAIARWVAAYGA